MIDRVRDQLRISPGYVRLLQLSLVIFIVLHYDACIMFWIGANFLDDLGQDGSASDSLLDTWISSNSAFVDQRTGKRDVPINELGTDQAYLISFYWACTTVMTVGFGDVTPRTTYEGPFRCYSICLCLYMSMWI